MKCENMRQQFNVPYGFNWYLCAAWIICTTSNHKKEKIDRNVNKGFRQTIRIRFRNSFPYVMLLVLKLFLTSRISSSEKIFASHSVAWKKQCLTFVELKKKFPSVYLYQHLSFTALMKAFSTIKMGGENLICAQLYWRF